MKDDPGVVFGDINLRESPIRSAPDGTPMNPGAGGWPTLRYFNAETGVGGAPVERKTTQKICDEFKVPDRMIEATKECMKVCKVSGEGCDDDEKAYLETWKSQDYTAEIAKLEDLVSEGTQKKMKQEIKLLAKLAAAAKDEL